MSEGSITATSGVRPPERVSLAAALGPGRRISALLAARWRRPTSAIPDQAQPTLLQSAFTLLSPASVERLEPFPKRYTWSGVGVNLRTTRPTAAAVRDGVRRVLEDPRFRGRATALRDELAAIDGPTRGAELLERLVRTGERVTRATEGV